MAGRFGAGGRCLYYWSEGLKKLLVILLLIPTIAVGQLTTEQQAKIDSLQQVITNAEHDSTIINAWKNWDDIVYSTDHDLSIELNEKIENLSTKNLSEKITEQERFFFKKANIYAYGSFGYIFMRKGDFDKAIDNYSKGLALSEELKLKETISTFLRGIGNASYYQGNYDKAINHYERGLMIAEEGNDKAVIAGFLNNIGNIYRVKGDYAKGIDYFTRSLKMCEELGDKIGVSNSCNNMAIIYKNQDNFDKAIEYTSRSLKIKQELGDKNGTAGAYINIGNIYARKVDYASAFEYYTKGLTIYEEGGNKNGIASSHLSIGNIYQYQDDYAKAVEHYQMSLTINEETGNRNNISSSYNLIGSVYKKEGDIALDAGKTTLASKKYAAAIEYNKKSLDVAVEIGAKVSVKVASKTLWKTYKASHQYKSALEVYELYIETSDSLASEANQKEVIRQGYKYEYEKQAAADSVVNAEAKKVADAKLTAEQAEKKRLKSESNRQKLENKNQQQQAYFLYGILGIAVLFGGFIFNRFKVTQKQKGIIESQKDEVEQQKEKVDQAYEQLEEKNTEILDSINYAKRIQSAILPPDKLVKEYLQNSFILYKPKDIVAGDFYWMEPTKNGILFAAADCTGHGVPGAMVSVVCNNALNRSVREYGLTDPGKILDKTREIVIQEFEKSEDEVKDGMDIALCSLQGNTLKYAGAHNPLWIVPGSSERHAELIEADVNGPALRLTQSDPSKAGIIEIKANKQPIGKFDTPLAYTTHTFELQPNDVFYIFSDGFVDQFGGERGKKFKPKALRELLLSIQDQSMDQQRELINQAFEKWQGDLEQVDDVCVIGVRI
jgi:serine phosphatase RsbU (regulator of sigma subunit)/tetratricopeptide (TPR) repeat protein